ncbi:MAG: 1-acyl-sn-glycerol-3-phosphate acyltransferase [Bdellovibrionota bacterium]|nr:1-acyl-sn-glycerol-3-phosphate acyltransferase [Bdellovibrionota bacterium]
MRVILSFMMLMFIKTFSKLFYRLELKWLSDYGQDFDKIRLIIFLNHTSLYEPLFVAAAPNWFLYRLARKMVAPGADKTLNRPIVGFFWKLMGPGMVSISRKRDKTWYEFLEAIQRRSVIVIAPEGRMKRKSGLDSEGKPMSIRAGVAEIFEELNEGRLLIAYSGGLHHVQHPGEHFPRLFKTIKLNLEAIEIPEYKAQFSEDPKLRRKEFIADLHNRLAQNTPE